MGIQYVNGKLNKAIDKTSGDITEKINSLKIIPKTIPIKKRIEIQAMIYEDDISSDEIKKAIC